MLWLTTKSISLHHVSGFEQKILWSSGIEPGMADPSGFRWHWAAVLRRLGYWGKFAVLQETEGSEAVANVVK